MRGRVGSSVCQSSPHFFIKETCFRVNLLDLNDINNDDEITASDVPLGTCFEGTGSQFVSPFLYSPR